MARVNIPFLLVCAGLSFCAMARAQQTGSANPPVGVAAYRCTQAVCEIKVVVDDCSGGGGVRIDRPIVEVVDIASLHWKIDAAGRRFAQPGVVVEAPEGEFEAEPVEKTNEFRLRDRNSIMGDFLYSYTLHVQGCQPVRGWIRNIAL